MKKEYFKDKADRGLSIKPIDFIPGIGWLFYSIRNHKERIWQSDNYLLVLYGIGLIDSFTGIISIGAGIKGIESLF